VQVLGRKRRLLVGEEDAVVDLLALASAVLGQLVVVAAIAEFALEVLELRRRPLRLVVELAVEYEWFSF
jgi:hypothetical protein